MSIAVTQEHASLPTTVYVVDITGLTADGSTKNSCTIACPWTPTRAIVQSYGTVPGAMTYDPATITATNIDIYAAVSTGNTAGATKCKAYIW